jgi:proprotein convertase subtilisin/kexin type 5
MNCTGIDATFEDTDLNACTACYSGCADCFGDGENECYSCESGYLLENYECSTTCTIGQNCYEQCGVGFVLSEDQNECKPCADNCDICTTIGVGKSSCLVCTEISENNMWIANRTANSIF